MPNPDSRDEISLRELYGHLRKRSKSIALITLGCGLMALLYSLVKPPVYTYEGCISLGVVGKSNTGENIYIEKPSNVIAKASDAFIPAAVASTRSSDKNLLIGKNFTLENPKDSAVICIRYDTSKSNGAIVSSVERQVLAATIEDNDKLSAVNLAAANADVANIKSSAQLLATELKNNNDQIEATQGELKLIAVKRTVLSDQEQALNHQIARVRPLLPRAAANSEGNATALTTIIQSNQVSQEQRHLFALQMQAAVTLPKEQITLENTLKALQRNKSNLLAKQAANAAQLDLAEASVTALQKTQMIRPPSRSSLPVGPSKAVIVILGLFIGFFVSLMYVFVRVTFGQEELGN